MIIDAAATVHLFAFLRESRYAKFRCCTKKTKKTILAYAWDYWTELMESIYSTSFLRTTAAAVRARAAEAEEAPLHSSGMQKKSTFKFK